MASIIGIVAIVVAALIYFATEQKRKRERQADAERTAAIERAEEHRRLEAKRDERIQRVVDEYRDLAQSLRASNLHGMLKAGVLSLEDSSEVQEACSRIDQLGLTPGIPPAYEPELESADLLHFFQLLQENSKAAVTDRVVRETARNARRIENA